MRQRMQFMFWCEPNQKLITVIQKEKNLPCDLEEDILTVGWLGWLDRKTETKLQQALRRSRRSKKEWSASEDRLQEMVQIVGSEDGGGGGGAGGGGEGGRGGKNEMERSKITFDRFLQHARSLSKDARAGGGCCWGKPLRI